MIVIEYTIRYDNIQVIGLMAVMVGIDLIVTLMFLLWGVSLSLTRRLTLF